MNHENIRYCSDINPHSFRGGHSQTAEKIREGILENHIAGHISIEKFFKSSFTQTF